MALRRRWPGSRSETDRACTGAAGFTFAETLVAVGLLGTAFLGLVTLFLSGHANISESGRGTAASIAAQSLAENLRNQPSADLPFFNGMTTDDPLLCPGAPGSRINTVCTDWISQVSLLPEGRGAVTVAQAPNPSTGIVFYNTIITVTWTEVGRGGRQVTLVAGRSD